MSDRIAISGFSIDRVTGALQAQLICLEGKWFVFLPDLSTVGYNSMHDHYGPLKHRKVPLDQYLKSAQILFPT